MILSGAGAIGPAGPNGESAGAVLEVDGPLVMLVDARAIVDLARRAILPVASEQILAGRRPDGGPQRPVSTWTAQQPGRISEHRGAKSGHMADELQATAIVGDTGRAHSYIQAPPDRNAFVGSEAKRGVRYLAIGPAHAAAAEKAVAEGVAAMVEGLRVEPEQGAPTAAEEQGRPARKPLPSRDPPTAPGADA